MIIKASDGTELHYTIAGTGVPLVLVGGKTSTIESAWWRYLPVLSRHLRTIALDNRGAGQSDKPDFPYTTGLMAQDVLAVLASAGERSAHFIGISLGGMIVQQLALTSPTAVRSLILVATHCGGDGLVNEPPPARATQTADKRLARYANLYEASFLEEHGDWVEEDARRFGKMPLHAINRQDQAVRNHRSCDRLGEIKQPALVIHGRQDRMVPVNRAEQLAAGLPNCELVLLPGGHQVHSEQFDTLVPLLLAFIARVEAARD